MGREGRSGQPPSPSPFPHRGEKGNRRDVACYVSTSGEGAGGEGRSGQPPSPSPFPHRGEKRDEHRAVPPRPGMGEGAGGEGCFGSPSPWDGSGDWGEAGCR